VVTFKSEVLDILRKARKSHLLTHFLWKRDNPVKDTVTHGCWYIISAALSLLVFLSPRLMFSLARRSKGTELEIWGCVLALSTQGCIRDSVILT
jgi:hypothetical protein